MPQNSESKILTQRNRLTTLLWQRETMPPAALAAPQLVDFGCILPGMIFK
jgi:hypothetical protein